MIETGISQFAPRTKQDMKRVDRLAKALDKKDELMTHVRKHLNLSKKPHQNRVLIPTIEDRLNHTTRKQAKPTMHSFTRGRNVPSLPEGFKIENPFTTSLQALKTKSRSKNVYRPEKPYTGDSCTVEKYCQQRPWDREKSLLREKTQDFTGTKLAKRTRILNGCAINEKLMRLQVPDFPAPKGRIEYEPGFFSMVQGRPFKDTIKPHGFAKMERTAFFESLFAGSFRDQILRRREHFEIDLQVLKNANSELDQAQESWGLFLNEGHDEDVTLVKQQLVIEHIEHYISEELVKARGKIIRLKSSIFKLDYRLAQVFLCRDILVKLSPAPFRLKWAQAVRAHTANSQMCSDVLNLYTDFCRYNPESGADNYLDEAIKQFIEDLRTLGPPMIYFTKAWQIDVILRQMELECVRRFADLSKLRGASLELNRLMKDVRKYHDKNNAEGRKKVRTKETIFRQVNERHTLISDDAHKEINVHYKENTSGDILLETMGLVEVLYEDIFGPSSFKYETIVMMTLIEEEIMRVNKELEDIGDTGFQRYEKKIMKATTNETHAALNAKELLNDVQIFARKANLRHSQAMVGRFWKVPVRRSRIPTAGRKKRADSKKFAIPFTHLNTTGILGNDDNEETIGKLLRKIVLPRDLRETESSSDLESSGDTSLLKASGSVYTSTMDEHIDNPASSVGSTNNSSYHSLDLGYDSEDELLKETHQRRKSRQIPTVTQPVLYELKTIDDRFMVESEQPFVPKDRRHEHRAQQKRNNMNALAWP